MSAHVTNPGQFAPYTNLIEATTHWEPNNADNEQHQVVDLPRDSRGKVRHDMYFTRTPAGYQQAIRNSEGFR